MYRQRRGHAEQRGASYILLLLAQQVMNADTKPPVTVGLIGLMSYIHFFTPLPNLYDVCLGAAEVLQGQYIRLGTALVYHFDDIHLYYNMVSLLWKGVQLETSMGSEAYAAMIGILAVLSDAVYIALGYILAVYFDYPHVLYSCAVGFSGVLFAMKVVLSHQSAAPYSDVHGIRVPTKYLAWAELVLISILVPRASFWGHLSGILAGLIYIHGKKLYSTRLRRLLTPPRSSTRTRHTAYGQSRFYGGGVPLGRS